MFNVFIPWINIYNLRLDEFRGVKRVQHCSGKRSGGGLAVTSCHLPAWEPVISLIMWLS